LVAEGCLVAATSRIRSRRVGSPMVRLASVCFASPTAGIGREPWRSTDSDDVELVLRSFLRVADDSRLGRLVEDANTPTLHELMDRAGGRAPLAKAAKAVRSDRDAR
jgi:hypothetical protein